MFSLELVLVIVLLVLLIALFAISYAKKKKFNTEMSAMREDLKTGDKVMTDSGIVGEVVDSFMDEEYKYFVLKSGRGNNEGFFTVHANAIYYVFGKEANQQAKEKVVVKVAPKVETKSEGKKEESKEEK